MSMPDNSLGGHAGAFNNPKKKSGDQTGVEILAPAGSLKTLYTAIAMGADAVYVGGPRFGARAFADNPSVDELTEAITHCHIHGKKLYLTVNTLLNDREIDELPDMLTPLADAGLDAVIVQDPGVLSFIHELYPKLAIHASTQMALFSGKEAERLRTYGVTRFVPARELTIDEIKKAGQETDLEIEVFVHGALCVCYSGWCLMSEHIGGRSGNRGMCAGPCRLPYRMKTAESFVLNAKDMETLLHIPELIEAGIDSFKIEGRMKSTEYSSYLAYLYRHYSDVYIEEGAGYYQSLIDDRESVLWRDRKSAMELYNRGGFFSSFLFYQEEGSADREQVSTIEPHVKGHYGLPVGEVIRVSRGKNKSVSVDIHLLEPVFPQDVFVIRDKNGEVVYDFTLGKSSDNKMSEDRLTVPVGKSAVKAGNSVFRIKNATLLTEIRKMIEAAERDFVIPVKGYFSAKRNEPISLTIAGAVSSSVFGTVPEEAKSRAVSEEDIRKRLSLGGTGLVWESLDIETEDGLFIPLGELRELKRQAVARWKKDTAHAYIQSRDRNLQCGNCAGLSGSPQIADDYGNTPWIRVHTPKQFQSVMEYLEDFHGDRIVVQAELDGFPPDTWQTFCEETSTVYGCKTAFSLPRAFRGKDKERFIKNWDSHEGQVIWKNAVFVANSMASLVFRDRYLPDAPTVADDNLYMTNKRAVLFYKDQGVQTGPARCYGRIPVMISAHSLSDDTMSGIITPKGDRFAVVKPSEVSYRIVYTADPYTSGTSDEAFGEYSGSRMAGEYSPVRATRIDLTTEDGEQIKEVLKKWL